MIGRDDEAMAPKAPVKHQVGEPLDALSVEELRHRVDLLHEEIARLETAAAAKEASRQAADAFFRRDSK